MYPLASGGPPLNRATPTGAQRAQGLQECRRCIRLTCTGSWIHLQQKKKDHAAAYAARAVYGRSKGWCTNAQQQPSSSTVALTRATSAPRQCSRRSRVNGVVGWPRGVSDCVDACILKCSHQALIAALQANCSAKDGLPIAITISMNVHITGNHISKKLRRYMERSLSTCTR